MSYDDRPTIALTKALVARPSVTPEDGGCQTLIAERLSRCGFTIESLPFGKVSNLWAVHGDAGPIFCFAGHTDVVPTGPVDAWRFPPFEPTEEGGYLYGRGVADMKASIAAMVIACERFVTQHPQHPGRLALLITSDEEGPAVDGTQRVMQHITERGLQITHCVVGEPSSSSQLGDVIKNGRRGSLNGHLKIHGRQGHIAYPHLADNPIHRFADCLQALCQTHWDQGNAYFEPTSFQISNIQAGTGVTNVIPGTLSVRFNFRYSPASSASELQQRVEALLTSHHLEYTLEWTHSGEAFLTEEGSLVAAARGAIKAVTGRETRLSTGGGTSDGRFIAPTGAQVIELGPENATIHQVDERLPVAQIEPLSEIYHHLLSTMLA